MPAILRILLPKYNALVCDIRPYAFYDVVGVRRVGSATLVYGSNGMSSCNTMPCRGWVGLYKIYKWCGPSAQSRATCRTGIYYGCIGHSLTHTG